MTIEEAVKTPVRENKAKIYIYKVFAGNLSQISQKFGINKTTLLDRIKIGMTIEEAIEIGINYNDDFINEFVKNGGNIKDLEKN